MRLWDCMINNNENENKISEKEWKIDHIHQTSIEPDVDTETNELISKRSMVRWYLYAIIST